MRFTASEKLEIIRLVEQSDLGVKLTLSQLNIPKSTFYDWYARYREKGFKGLHPKVDPERKQWNQIPEHEREEVVKEALEQPEKSPRELAFHITDNQGMVYQRVECLPHIERPGPDHQSDTHRNESC